MLELRAGSQSHGLAMMVAELPPGQPGSGRDALCETLWRWGVKVGAVEGKMPAA